MDRTINNDDVARVLAEMDRKKKAEENAEENSIASQAASALGTNTPVTLLMDIRQAISDLTSVVSRQQDYVLQQMEAAERRHKETLAYMQQLSDSIVKLSYQPQSSMPIRSTKPNVATEITESSYYHGGVEIKNSHQMMACVLIQLERLISRNVPAPDSGSLDTISMDIKEWTAVLRGVCKAESSITSKSGKLALPAISQTESTFVLGVVTAPTHGRNVMCKPDHISEIIHNCPGVAGCIEEVRVRILKCPGLVGYQRALSLASIKFPYVNPDGSLAIVPVSIKEIGSRSVMDKVAALNNPQKELYITQILRDNERPMKAVMEATNYTTKRTT